MVLTEVPPGSAAARARLQEGDVIQQLNGKPVPTAAAFRMALRKLAQGDISVKIVRQQSPLVVTIEQGNLQ